MNVRIASKEQHSLAQENAALRKKVATLEEQLADLQGQLDWLKKQVFGSKTEQTSVIMDGGTQLSLMKMSRLFLCLRKPSQFRRISVRQNAHMETG